MENIVGCRIFVKNLKGVGMQDQYSSNWTFLLHDFFLFTFFLHEFFFLAFSLA